MSDPREGSEFFPTLPAKLDDPSPDLAYFRRKLGFSPHGCLGSTLAPKQAVHRLDLVPAQRDASRSNGIATQGTAGRPPCR